jgi:hypothetical protein
MQIFFFLHCQPDTFFSFFNDQPNTFLFLFCSYWFSEPRLTRYIFPHTFLFFFLPFRVDLFRPKGLVTDDINFPRTAADLTWVYILVGVRALAAKKVRREKKSDFRSLLCG